MPEATSNPLTFNDLVFSNGNLSTEVEMMQPLTDENLARVKPSTSVIHFCADFSGSDYARIAKALNSAPHAILRYWGLGCNLEFLKFFPTLKRLELSSVFDSLIPLGLLSAHLVELDLRVPREGPFSLKPLENLIQLKKLSLTGFWEGGIKTTPDFINALASLALNPGLEILFLNLVRLPAVDIFGSMDSLRSVSIVESPIRDISGIGLASDLVHLHLGYLLNSNLDFLSDLCCLQYLSLDHLSKIEALPSLAPLSHLRRVKLRSMKRLKKLSSIANAPNIEDLVLEEERVIEPGDLQCFVGHSKLKHAWTDLGAAHKNIAVADLLGLPRAGARSHFRFQTETELH
jgi:hypothetical protein